MLSLRAGQAADQPVGSMKVTKKLLAQARSHQSRAAEPRIQALKALTGVGEYVPMMQWEQWEDPQELAYVPFWQARHSVLSSTAAKVPGMHMLQAGASTALEAHPAGQTLHQGSRAGGVGHPAAASQRCRNKLRGNCWWPVCSRPGRRLWLQGQVHVCSQPLMEAGPLL